MHSRLRRHDVLTPCRHTGEGKQSPAPLILLPPCVPLGSSRATHSSLYNPLSLPHPPCPHSSLINHHADTRGCTRSHVINPCAFPFALAAGDAVPRRLRKTGMTPRRMRLRLPKTKYGGEPVCRSASGIVDAQGAEAHGLVLFALGV